MSKLLQNRMRRFAIAVAVTAGGAGLTLSFVTPAHAANTTDHMVVQAASVPAVVAAPAGQAASCAGTGALCLYVNSGFVDGPGKLTGSNADWRAFAHASCQTRNWSDCVSSIDNETSTGNTVFKNINGGGDSRCILTDTSFSNLATAKYVTGAKSIMNDSISSNLRGPC